MTDVDPDLCPTCGYSGVVGDGCNPHSPVCLSGLCKHPNVPCPECQGDGDDEDEDEPLRVQVSSNVTAIVGEATTRVYMAFLRLQVRDGRVTVPSLTTETGLSPGTVDYHLKELRRYGLVESEVGLKGTLRAPVAVRAVA